MSDEKREPVKRGRRRKTAAPKDVGKLDAVPEKMEAEEELKKADVKVEHKKEDIKATVEAKDKSLEDIIKEIVPTALPKYDTLMCYKGQAGDAFVITRIEPITLNHLYEVYRREGGDSQKEFVEILNKVCSEKMVPCRPIRVLELKD